MGKVSIIMPVYNAENTLSKCIDSIINNDYLDYELIIINDGSTDNSLKILEEYKKINKKIILLSQENKGVSAARNLGIETATGEFCAFVDADDYIENDIYKQIFSKIGDSDIVAIGYYEHTEKGSITHMPQIADTYHGEDNIKQIIGFSLEDIYRWDKGGSLFEKRIGGELWQYFFNLKIIKNNQIRFDERLKYKEDEIFLAEFLLYCESVSKINKPLYHYVRREDSATKTLDNQIRINSKFYMLDDRDHLRALYKKEYGKDLLDDYAGSNIMSVLEMGLLCIGNYKVYKKYINQKSVQESIKRIKTRKFSFKLGTVFRIMKMKCYFVIYFIMKMAVKFKINIYPEDI